MSNKLKILSVGNLPLDLKSIRGGVDAAIINLFHGFSQMDEIELLHLVFSNQVVRKSETKFSDNIRILFLPLKSKFLLLDYYLNQKELKELICIEGPDVIHIQEAGPHLLRFLGIPRNRIVVTQHGIMREEYKYANGISDKLKFSFKYLVERHIFPLFRNVIFISDYNRKLFPGNPRNEARIFNSVNPIFFSQALFQAQYANSLIYVGVINRRKNLSLVLEALHALKTKGIQYELHVVGGYKEGDKSHERIIFELVKMTGLNNQVKFYGWLTQEEIMNVYKKCTYFILPSLQETMPISVAEAMVLGKIGLATDVGAISEILKNGESGFLFGKNNLKELVKILEALHYRSLPVMESTEIRDLGWKRYHPQVVAKQTFEFYQRVVSDNSNK